MQIIKSQTELLDFYRENNIKLDTFFFSFEKLKCRYGNYLALSKESLDFLVYLDALRQRMPYEITNFFRSPKHPYYKGGSSKHCKSLAIDLDPTMKSVLDLQNDTETKSFIINSFKGVGFYNNHLHLDWRDKKIYWVGLPDNTSSDGWKYEYFEKFDQAYSFFKGCLK